MTNRQAPLNRRACASFIPCSASATPTQRSRFFNLLGLEERRRMENEAGRFTLIFLGVPGDEGGEVELTYNWDESGYRRRAQFRPSRLPGRRHLRDLPAADGRRRDDQPPAARRPHGVRPFARRDLGRAAAEGRRACRPPSRGRRCPTRANGDARSRRRPGLHRQLHLAGPRRGQRRDGGGRSRRCRARLAEAERRGWRITQVWNTHASRIIPAATSR